MNKLFYGDNLAVLRKDIKDESVDLCYIDPPFNSKRNYNQIYNNVGKEDAAQAQAFVDTWTWDDQAIDGLTQILNNERGLLPIQTVRLMEGLDKVLGRGSLLAYLVSMTLRIVEIHRVLKPTVSISTVTNQPAITSKSFWILFSVGREEILEMKLSGSVASVQVVPFTSRISTVFVQILYYSLQNLYRLYLTRSTT